MYQSPDFVKVDVNVKDVFANYLQTGCPMDQFGIWRYIAPCEGTPDYAFEGDTYISLGWGDGCYSTLLP